jgi:hypothetical protein
MRRNFMTYAFALVLATLGFMASPAMADCESCVTGQLEALLDNNPACKSYGPLLDLGTTISFVTPTCSSVAEIKTILVNSSCPAKYNCINVRSGSTSCQNIGGGTIDGWVENLTGYCGYNPNVPPR